MQECLPNRNSNTKYFYASCDQEQYDARSDTMIFNVNGVYLNISQTKNLVTKGSF